MIVVDHGDWWIEHHYHDFGSIAAGARGTFNQTFDRGGSCVAITCNQSNNTPSVVTTGQIRLTGGTRITGMPLTGITALQMDVFNDSIGAVVIALQMTLVMRR